jgi:hypothetical protein
MRLIRIELFVRNGKENISSTTRHFCQASCRQVRGNLAWRGQRHASPRRLASFLVPEATVEFVFTLPSLPVKITNVTRWSSSGRTVAGMLWRSVWCPPRTRWLWRRVSRPIFVSEGASVTSTTASRGVVMAADCARHG